MKNIIVYIGMDVHKKSYSLCTYLKDEDKVLFKEKISSDLHLLLDYFEAVKKNFKKKEVTIKCGYEAGCIGYSLKKALDDYDVDCIIMAPTTMLNINNKRVKTDKRDAENIAKNLALGTYKEIHMITDRDEEIKEYIRMRDDHKLALTKIKHNSRLKFLAMLLHQ